MSEQKPNPSWTHNILTTPSEYRFMFSHSLRNDGRMDFDVAEFCYEECESVLRGYIEYDGSISLELDWLIVGYRESTAIAHIVEHIWATAARVMPGFDSELAGYPPKKEKEEQA